MPSFLSLNRTILELKHDFRPFAGGYAYALNRTILELKLADKPDIDFDWDSQSHYFGIETVQIFTEDNQLPALNRTILELKLSAKIEILFEIFTLNRTILELKLMLFFYEVKHSSTLNRTILELKPVRINLSPTLHVPSQSHYFGIETYLNACWSCYNTTLNRTILELKHQRAVRPCESCNSLNRTILELKQGNRLRRHRDTPLSIALFWN